jgi:hypothetical protein
VELRAVGQRVERTDNTLYILDLHCALDACALDVTEVNDCKRQPGEAAAAFTLRTRKSATWAGSLEMVSQSEHSITLVVYQATHKHLPATFRFEFSQGGAHGSQIATGFSANGVIEGDGPLFPPRTFDIEPVVPEKATYALDCPIRLRGSD